MKILATIVMIMALLMAYGSYLFAIHEHRAGQLYATNQTVQQYAEEMNKIGYVATEADRKASKSLQLNVGIIDAMVKTVKEFDKTINAMKVEWNEKVNKMQEEIQEAQRKRNRCP